MPCRSQKASAWARSTGSGRPGDLTGIVAVTRPRGRVLLHWCSGAGTRVLAVVLHHVDRRLLRGSRTRVDSDVTRDKIGLLVRMRALILSHEPPGPGINCVIARDRIVIGVRVDVWLLFRKQPVERLASLFLRKRGAVSLARRPPVRRHDPLVQGIVSRVSLERVR